MNGGVAAMPGPLAGRRALVTGAAGDIGAAISSALCAAGCLVAVTDLDLVAAQRQVQEMTEAAGAVALELDVRSSSSANDAIATAVDRLGGLDILVNNAGVARDARLDRLTDEDWNAVLDIDLRGYFFCARAAAPHLRAGGHGRIVNISSRAHLGNRGQANYSAAKAGVIGLTRALSLELGRDAITVNAVAPGMIDTALVRNHPKADQIVERAAAATPMGRIGAPGDVASVVAFLASDGASYISGEVIHVTGGRY